ncbi:MAG: T9SS type A sorting domain-containing protein [Sphingobacteriales bacterium]|nr:T9SS type A sorting domain-containing protein [Sphingobacteriales bacterium]
MRKSPFEDGSITINNLQGVAVFHQPVYKGVSALDLPALPQGMYWVVFQNKNYYSTTKIIIQP